MRGSLVPFILIPRFTSYVGAGSYPSVPIELSEYASGAVTLWRGPLLGTSPDCEVWFELSRDGTIWSPMPAVPFDPGDNGTVQCPVTTTNRLFRVRVELTGTNPAVTMWCAGALERRVAN